jgi:hypothetical protein
MLKLELDKYNGVYYGSEDVRFRYEQYASRKWIDINVLKQ